MGVDPMTIWTLGWWLVGRGLYMFVVVLQAWAMESGMVLAIHKD